MSYQALARKWRPGNFEELVGQDHVRRALVNGIENDRLHHAFLFTGTRGVGKTTIARILARCINCESGMTTQPCGTCNACVEIDEGRMVDLIEVDAASRTGIDDTRELLDNVQYAPTRARYKVYLIDEVHQLSTHSFNALLKTLEEPPPHVKFLFATTDPQKVPVTVLSRCLQFHLKRLDQQAIAYRIVEICKAENIELDDRAVESLSLAADGSLRDGLSLLDQAIAFCGGKLTGADVDAMLGTIDHKHVQSILRAVAAGDGAAAVQAIEDAAEFAPDYLRMLKDLARQLHQAAVTQVVPEAEASQFTRELAALLSPELCQLCYQIAVAACGDLDLAPDRRSGVEMAVLRMIAFRPATALADSEASPPPSGGPGGGAKSPSANASAREAAKAAAGVSSAAPAKQSPAEAPKATSAPPSDKLDPVAQWESVLDAIGLRGPAREMCNHGHPTAFDGQRLDLVIDEGCAQFDSPRSRTRLAEHLSEYFERSVEVRVKVDRVDNATPAQKRTERTEQKKARDQQVLAEDSKLDLLKSTFDARVVETRDSL